jgi:HNH endonuclease
MGQLLLFQKRRLAPILPRITPELEKAFWAKVHIGPQYACWPFDHYKGTEYSRIDYGQLSYPKFKLGDRSFQCHRIAYALDSGHDPIDYIICHECDVPICCNPQHLWAGTDWDNHMDCVRKGRHIRRRRW